MTTLRAFCASPYVRFASLGMLLIPVLLTSASGQEPAPRQEPSQQHDGHDSASHPAEDAPPQAPAQKQQKRKVLFYRNPMGAPDTSPVPKKDSMGMDYIPVYADDAPQASTVKVSPEKIQKTGVRTSLVSFAPLVRTVRAPGTVKPDERTLRSISLRSDAFIEKLYVNEMGRNIKAGEPLFRIYSQEMLRALIDLRRGRADLQGSGAALLNAEQKLQNLEVPQSAINEARTAREVPMSMDWPSPVSGIIMEKNVVEGQMARMGEELFRIVDLSTVWVIASVSEQDFAGVAEGSEAIVTLPAYPGEQFKGKVTLVLHELDAQTRTASVRVEVKNPDHRIRHEMYADVEFAGAGSREPVVSVPVSAVINSGARQVVFVDLGDGRFEPRAVKLGIQGQNQVEIREGLKEGDRIVVSGNFLIDAESNLNAALATFTSGATEGNAPEQPQ